MTQLTQSTNTTCVRNRRRSEVNMTKTSADATTAEEQLVY
jgi:hypothetical protein